MPDIASLSDAKRKLLEQYLRGELVQSCRITPRPQHELAPLSYAQESMWRTEQRVGIPPLYNEAITIYRDGPMDETVLQRALAEIVRRHEIWRTTYEAIDGRPCQRIHESPTWFPLSTVDVRRFTPPEAEREILRVATQEACRPFDLVAGPLLRAVLVRVAADQYRLLITAHLSIIDGVSIYEILPWELSQLYESFQRAEASPLPALPIQYADYAWWERHRPETEMEDDLQYWRRLLGGKIVPLRWPAKTASQRTHGGAIQTFRIADEAVQAAEQLCKCEGITLFACLQAAVISVLYTYTAQRQIRIGTFSSFGRKRSEVRGLLGHFLSPVVLHFDLDEDLSFAELLRRAQQVTSEAISHDSVSLDTLARELLPGVDADTNPFFNVGMSLQPRTPHLPGWSVTTMDAPNGGTFWDLYVAFIERPSGMVGRAQYNRDRFDSVTIAQLIHDVENTLIAGARAPHLPLRVTA